MKKIAIDLDDVVFEFTKSILKEGNNYFKRKISFEEVNHYYFPDHFQITLEDFMNFLGNLINKGLNQKLVLVEKSKEGIIELSKNYKIIFLTSRDFREGTLESLKSHFSFLDFDLIFSSNPYSRSLGKTKGELCIEHEIDIMIEDSKEHAEICSSHGIKTFLIDKPWNQEDNLSENIIRVKDWNEILEKIENE